MIILDPPAFAKSQRAVEAALDGLRVAQPPGARRCCGRAGCWPRRRARRASRPEAFFEAVKEAGYNAGVELALVEERYQPPDHPIRLQFREGRYLKFYVLQSV